MRFPLRAALFSLSFLLLLPAACSGANGGDDLPLDEEFPTLSFDGFGEDSGLPLDDSMLPATVEARVARTIEAQDAALATAVAEGVSRVLRGDPVAPTPTSLAEDEVRVPVFRRGGPTRPAAETPVPDAEFCAEGLSPHVSADPAYVVCYPDGWRPEGGGRFADPRSGAYVEVRRVDAPAGAGPDEFYRRFREEMAADAGTAWGISADAVNHAFGRYGLTYEYMRQAAPPQDCLERVTAKAHLSAQRPEGSFGYAVIFVSCDRGDGVYEARREGTLSGFREGTP